MKKKKLTGIMFILPGLLGMCVFYIIPFGGTVYYTFTRGITEIKIVYLDNFKDLIGNPTFELAVRNTLTLMGIGIPLLIILALTISMILINGKYLWERWAMLAPLVVPSASVVAGWRFFLDQSPVQSPMVVVIGIFIWKNIGYLVIILSSAMLTLPREYNEVFALECSSKIQLMRKIILPLITPMMFFAVVISVMNSFKIFREVYTLFGNDPPKSIYMLQHFMNNNFFKLNYQRLSTAAFLLSILFFIGIGIFLYWQRKILKQQG